MSIQPLLGIDWGTTNRRAYVLDTDGKLIRQHADESGILTVRDNFEGALQTLLKLLELERADVVMSGMVGSRNGWQQVPYLSVNQSLSQLPALMVDVPVTLRNVRCRIVPGYHFNDRHGLPDVMRGEETQVFGAMLLGASDGWFVLPGTHSKWVRLERGNIAEIITFMTGELFALLSQDGTLAPLMKNPQWNSTALKAGITAAQHDGFTHAAFCCRALVVTDQMPAGHVASYVSGLLVGAELKDIRQRADLTQEKMPIQIIGNSPLAKQYVEALEFFGIPSLVWQSDDVYIAALRMLFGRVKN